MQATVRFEHELLAVEHEHTVSCMLELTAPPAPSSDTRTPLALALVIDRSGSMAGEKLAVTRRCAAFLAERLDPADRLAIVSFDDHVRLDVPLTDLEQDRQRLLYAIGQIMSGGQTNLSGGWLKGVETLAAVGDDEQVVRRVLLLTDGMANVGITDPGQLTTMARASAGDGIGTTTIGFGDGFSEDLLAAMADAGNGSMYFAETPDAAPGIFAQEFADLLSVVAQNVSVEIRPSTDDVVMLGVLNDFPIVAVDGGLQAQLGDAYGDDLRRVVFQLSVPALATLGPAKIADVVLRYTEVGEQVAMHEVTVPVIVNAVSAEDAKAAVPDAEVVEEIVVLAAARAQAEARELADRGELDKASAKLRDAAESLRLSASGSDNADELLRKADELKERSQMWSEGLYDAMERKRSSFTERMMREMKRRPSRDE